MHTRKNEQVAAATPARARASGARGGRQGSAVFIALFNRGPTTTTVKAALSEVGEAIGMPTCSRGFAATEAFGRPSLRVTERGTVQAAVGGYDALLFKLVCR